MTSWPRDYDNSGADRANFIIFKADDLRIAPISSVYHIFPGEFILITASGLPEGVTIQTEALISVADTNSACPPTLLGVRPTIGGAENWVIDESHTQLYIALPGVYRFILSDASALEDTALLVVGRTLPLDKSPRLGVLVAR
jgi:hypothetical protein